MFRTLAFDADTIMYACFPIASTPAASHSPHSVQPTAAACMHLPTLARSVAALSSRRTFCTCWPSDQLIRRLFQQSRCVCKLHDIATTEGTETIGTGAAFWPTRRARQIVPLGCNRCGHALTSAQRCNIAVVLEPNCRSRRGCKRWGEGRVEQGVRAAGRVQGSAAPGFCTTHCQPPISAMDGAAAAAPGAHHSGALASVEQAHPGWALLVHGALNQLQQGDEGHACGREGEGAGRVDRCRSQQHRGESGCSGAACCGASSCS